MDRLGVLLLRNAETSWDVVLNVTDGISHVRIYAHKSVLSCQSKYFERVFTEYTNQFQVDITLTPGYVRPFVMLVRFLYLHEPTMIPDEHHEHVLSLCGFFEIPSIHELLSMTASLNEVPKLALKRPEPSKEEEEEEVVRHSASRSGSRLKKLVLELHEHNEGLSRRRKRRCTRHVTY